MTTGLFKASRLGVAVNLPTGASFDILLVNTPNFPVGSISFEFAKPTSSKITGIQKCAQFFLKILFTTKGTDLLNPTYGTQLPSLLVGANINLSSQELLSSIASSVQDAVQQCKILLNDATNDPASMINSVVVSDVSNTVADKLSIGLRLTTQAGETGSISLPAPLLDLPIFNG